MPDFNNRLLKIAFSSRKIWLNCIEILFLSYILAKKTDKISPTSFGGLILKAAFFANDADFRLCLTE
ncbi:hypothetical protein EC523_06865 [Avibacterium paragallinarum]|uniref:Uncharacterized protein n=1 Tax=Avibacterium paragallinarum TaxID=728 RepID=A0AAE5TIE2_AVIPA|nr:hypothetical protein C3364_12565 [Avibacterium paragallinarum]PXZ39158.1 hypothetical protein DM482_05660 [Avibacterium paragallinarum]PXZ41376.1 hypothetical protein DM481_06285 [Avibacterium paragallinarum]RZN75793.1 hypothetical protein EC523_06865 [Avibacterium paragallinarum]